MQQTRPKKEDFKAGCAPHGGRGMRRGQQISAGPGQPQLAMCEASGDGPHARSLPRANPVANALARSLPPLCRKSPSPAVPAQERQPIDRRISIRQRILDNEMGRINQQIKLQWMQTHAQLKALTCDMHLHFVGLFSNRVKDATTDAEREHLRLKSAQEREELFSDMKARIRASCANFGGWRWLHLKAELEAARKELIDDGNYDALVAVLENQVSLSNVNFQERALECAHAVWAEFVNELGFEKELLPA